MKCPVCGKENQEEARFCFYCGHQLNRGQEEDSRKSKEKDGGEDLVDTLSMKPLRGQALGDHEEDEDYEDYEEYENYEDYPSFKDQKRGPVWPKILGLIILCGLLGLGGYFGYQYYQRSQLERQAQANVDQENFQEALKIYQGLYEETQDSKYKNEMAQVQNLEKTAKNLKQAEEIVENKEEDHYAQAFQALLKIKKEGTKYSDQASQDIDKLIKQVEERTKDLVDQGYYSQALNIINPLLDQDPQNQVLRLLQEKTQGAKDAYLERVRQEEEAKRRREEELEKKKQEAEEAAKKAIEDAFGRFSSSDDEDD